MSKNYYDILGVSKSATDAEIKKSYQKLAGKWHPDKHQTNKEEAETKFKEIKAAYEVLKDPEKKAMFDQYGTIDMQQGGGFHRGSPVDIFGFGAGGRSTRQVKQVVISLKESITGCEKTIKYTKYTPCGDCDGNGALAENFTTCSHCHGNGHVSFMNTGMVMVCPVCQGKGKTIKVPCSTCNGAGQLASDDSITIRLPAGTPDTASMHITTDVTIQIRIMPHDYFVRQGLDLWLELEVDTIDAITGTSVNVQQVVGDPIKLTIPSGTQYGTKMKLAKKGVTYQDQTGHLYVVIKLITPTGLTTEQLDTLKNLRSF